MLGHVLRPGELLARTTYAVAEPDPRLAPWVAHYWSVCWRFAPGERFATATLDNPYANLTLERGGIIRIDQTGPGYWFTGPVTRGRFDVALSDVGSVVGIKFRIGGVLAFVDADLATLRDRTVPTAGVGLPVDWGDLPEDAAGAAPVLDRWLLDRAPADLDPAYVRFQRLTTLLDDPSLTTLEAVAERAGCDVRTLQRVFRKYAGVGPKWMLTRARVIDAVAALDSDTGESLADLAHRLGWFDQAHFTRDFRRVTGETPAAYARARRRGGLG